jgi:DNA-binding CsgD family transcriptional regulator
MTALYATFMHFAWPLTGRSAEMRLIEAALSDPGSSGVVVCGSAGVGKSRIAREALAAAESRRWEVRWTVGTTSARTLPLGALASWAASAGPDTLQLVRGVIKALTSAPPGCPVAVGVDDAQLLDDLSVFVLHQIVQRRAAKLVLTVRDGEPIPAAVQEVWKAGQFGRLDLQPLSRDETVALLLATLGGSVDPDATQRLWMLTRGNVLYLRNIVEHEVRSGRLAQQDGVWRWFGDPVVPPSLVELIESRIGALHGAVSDVMDALAAAEPLELAVLTRISDTAAVEEADARSLIRLEPVDDRVQVRVAHPLYSEVRRRRAPTTRLRRLRGLIAAELAAADDCDDIRMVVRRAALSLDSDLAPAEDLLLRAAEGAVWLGDHPLAARLADAAIRAGGGAEAKLVRAHALGWLSRGEEAEEVFAGIDASNFTDDERAALAFARAANMLFALKDAEAAKTLIDEASRTTTPQAHSCIDAFLTVYWAAMGKPAAATESAKKIRLDGLPGIVGALPALMFVIASGDASRVSEAVSAAEAGYEVVDRSLDAAGIRPMVVDAHIRALLQAGLVGEALNAAERVRQQAAGLPGTAEILSSGAVGRAALGAGRLKTASELLELAVETLAGSGPEEYGIKYHFQLQHTVALGMRGLTEEAGAALAELERQRHPSWRCLDYELGLARAWVAACKGAVSEATKILLSAAETARDNGQFAAEVMCLQTATQFGDRSCLPRLHELAAIAEGPRVGLAARFAAVVRSGDAAELAAVSEQFEDMGDVIAAVDSAAHAAIAYRRRDLRGSALGCSTRAEALAEQCGGARTPALRQAAERLPLTDREREIVMLLGEGLSNRDIAARLTLSIRTVEDHVHKAMAKTGTASRHDLAALLPRRRHGDDNSRQLN